VASSCTGITLENGGFYTSRTGSKCGFNCIEIISPRLIVNCLSSKYARMQRLC
jgi:hypothetical protein